MKKFFILLFITTFFACKDANVLSSDNGDFFYKDSEDCSCQNKDTVYTDKPKAAEITLRVSINAENKNVKVEIHEGNLNGTIVREYLADKSRLVDSLPLGTYTYAAKYCKNGDSIIVPVHARLDADGHECNGFYCYEILNNVVDLSLKF
ncbi:MAG: hypothetical protein II956_13150 [Bacteroidales bacterium]|nr:hypothetical protein [Bacteroidales bacterium]